MRMMQVASDQVVYVIAVRHGRMSTVGTMHVVGGVAGALMRRGAVGRVRGTYFQLVLVHVVAMRMV